MLLRVRQGRSNVRQWLSFGYAAIAHTVNKRFFALVAEARKLAEFTDRVPDDVIVYTLYSRSCDPTVEFLRREGKMNDEEIVEAMVATTFDGLHNSK